jgi:hypothetical protein
MSMKIFCVYILRKERRREITMVKGGGRRKVVHWL